MCAVLVVNKLTGAHSIDLGQFRSRRKMEISGKSSGDRGGYQSGVGGGFVRPHAPASRKIAWRKRMEVSVLSENTSLMFMYDRRIFHVLQQQCARRPQM